MRAPEIGLTGNIGSGKSTAARLLAERGAAVIDADVLAREVTDDADVLAEIAAALGPELVREGSLDRPAAARRVFGDPQARATLDAIVHPRVEAARRRRSRELQARRAPPPLIVHDVPLLFEVGLATAMDAVVVVSAPLAVRVARVTSRDGASPEEVRKRDATQLPQEEKVGRADYVLDNAGDEAELARQVDALWPRLLALTSRLA